MKDKIWRKSDNTLYVKFLNFEHLARWQCEGERMSSHLILAWAKKAWEVEGAPKLELTKHLDGDIRIICSGIGSYIIL